MQHENLLVEFTSTVVESILALNDIQTLKQSCDNPLTEKTFKIDEKLRTKWEKTENSNVKKLFVEFVLIDKQDESRIYPLEIWAFQLETITKTMSLGFDDVENLNMEKTSYLSTRLNL